jgi:hypothetical protein
MRPGSTSKARKGFAMSKLLEGTYAILISPFTREDRKVDQGVGRRFLGITGE